MLSTVNKKKRWGWIHNRHIQFIFLIYKRQNESENYWSQDWCDHVQPKLNEQKSHSQKLKGKTFCCCSSCSVSSEEWSKSQQALGSSLSLLNSIELRCVKQGEERWGKDRDRNWEREIEHSHRLKAALHPGQHLTATKLPFLPAHLMLYGQNTFYNIKP